MEDQDPMFDIAILTLKKDLKFGKTIKSITLPKKNEKFKEGSSGLISGFGYRQESAGSMSNTLLAVMVPTLKLSECKKLVKPYVPGTFCALSKKNRKDSCQVSVNIVTNFWKKNFNLCFEGDSGGPFVINNKLVGIVSYGIGCAHPKHPGVYTNVAAYMDFVTKEMKN